MNNKYASGMDANLLSGWYTAFCASFGRPARGVSKQKFLVSFRRKITIFGDFASQEMRNNPHMLELFVKEKQKVSFPT